MVNFSQNACRERYEALQAGTAKPTPESLSDPTPEVVERIESRRKKELKLRENQQVAAMEQQNVEGNGWSSRMREHF